MRCSLVLLTLFASLSACHKEPEGFEAVMGILDGTETPARVELAAAVGEGLVRVPVRLVNAYGAAVGAGQTITLSVEGADLSISSATVTLDAWGWGELEVESATPQAITVTATANSAGVPNGDPVTAWITGGAWDDRGLHRAWAMEEPPDKILPVNGGVAWASGVEIWVQPSGFGAPPVRVALFPGTIDGLVSPDIDSDGLPDLIAWSADQAYVLRGRAGGGFGWVAAFAADYGEIVSVAAGDFDDDISTDIAFAWASNGQGGFQPFGHDGLWGFAAMPPLDLGAEPWSIAAGAPSTPGADEIILLYDGDTSGRIRRFGLRSEGWTPVGVDVYGYDLERELPLGSTIEAVEDIDGDGLDDILFAQPIDGDGTRVLFIVTYGNGVMSRHYERPGLRYAVGDLSGDGVSDILLAEEEENILHLLTIDVEEATLFSRSIVTNLYGEAVAVGSVNGDTLRDALVVTDALLAFEGETDVEQNDRWIVRDEHNTLLYVSSVGPVLATSVDGQNVVLVFRLSSDGLYLYEYPMLWDGSTGTVSLDATDNFERVAVGNGQQGMDIAICDGVVYALGDDGTVVSAELDGLQRRGRVDAPGSVSVDCGPLAGGARVAVLEMGGTVSLYDEDLEWVSESSVGISSDVAVVAHAVGDAELATCGIMGCRVLAEDLDGDGEDEIYNSDDEALQAWGQSIAIPVPATTEPSVADLDGDGRLDLVFADWERGRVYVFRTLSGAMAPPLLLHGSETMVNAITAADVDADGVMELVTPIDSGRLIVSRPSSSVVVEE